MMGGDSCPRFCFESISLIDGYAREDYVGKQSSEIEYPLDAIDLITRTVRASEPARDVAAALLVGYEQSARALAFEVWEEYADSAITIAAYVSSWPSAFHKLACRAIAIGDARDVVQTILQGCEALRRLHIPPAYLPKELPRTSHDADDPYSAFVMGQIEDARSIVVYVYQAISSRDSTGAVRMWTNSFRSDPSPLLCGPEMRRDLSEADAFRNKVQPMAELLGLHQLGAAASNIADLMSDSLGFHRAVNQATKLAEALLESSSEEPAAAAISKVLSMVNSALEPVMRTNRCSKEQARWDWHHGASIGKRVLSAIHVESPTGSTTVSPSNLLHLGFVSVCADSVEAAYAVIATLHVHPLFQYQQGSFIDYVNSPRPGGYRALHTELRLRNAISEGSAGQSANLAYGSEFATAPETSFSLRVVVSYGLIEDRRRRLIYLQAKRAKRKNAKLTVFTPKQDEKELMEGSTVLDFAMRIHQGMVPYVSAAEINGVHITDRLHRLSPGDTVHCVVDKQLQLPPLDLSQTRHPLALRKIFQDAFSEQFMGRGWERLKTLISTEAVQPIAIDETTERALRMHLPAACELANHRFFSPSKKKQVSVRGENWWLNQIGLQVTSADDLARFDLQPKISEMEAVWLARRVIRLFLESLSPNVWIVPDATIARASSGRTYCKMCAPRLGLDDLSVETRGDALVFHRQRAPCAQNSSPLRVSKKNLPEFFVLIDAEDYDGLLRDIADAFSREQVPITQVHAERLSDQLAIVRFRTNLISRQNQKELKEHLKGYKKIKNVRFPNDTGPDPLERYLPPRRARINLAWEGAISPYVMGPPVSEAHLFYGRGQELQYMLQELDYVSTHQGRAVAIHGPLKIGKTSLAQRFLDDDVCRREDTLAVYHSLSTEMTWQGALRTIMNRLREHPQSSLLSELPPDTASSPISSWERLTQHVGEKGGRLVIVLDEVYPFLLERSDDLATKGEFQRFWTASLATSVLLVLIGPSSALNRLPPDMGVELRRARPVAIDGLLSADFAECLRAAKCIQPIRPRVGTRVAARAWEALGGNPFWLNHLGDRMWRMAKGRAAEREQIRVIEYTSEDLDRALDSLAREWILFYDRFAMHLAVHKPMAEVLVRTLAAAISDRHGAVSLGRAEIYDALSRTMSSDDANIKGMAKLIDCVIDCGGLVPSEFSSDQFSLGAPILAKALAHRHVTVEGRQ